MFLIAGIQLGDPDSYHSLDGCSLDPDNHSVVNRQSSSQTLILQPIYPTALDRWLGFDTEGVGEILIFITDTETGREYTHVGNRWKQTTTRTMYSVREFRSRVIDWQGPLQIGIDGEFECATILALHAGYRAAGNTDTISTALIHFFTVDAGNTAVPTGFQTCLSEAIGTNKSQQVTGDCTIGIGTARGLFEEQPRDF